MPNPTDKAYFVELNDFSIVLARSSALRSSVVIEDIREVPLDNKAGLEEAVQAVFPETKSGTADVFAALRPKQRGLHLSSADEGKKFATLSALPGVLSEPALANFSPGEFTAVYAGNGLAISGQGAPWLLAAAAKDSYAEALATLQGLKLVPSRISPATLSAAGGLASALKLKADGSTALLFEFGEFCTHLLLVSRDGVEAVRSVPVTMDKVAEAVQVELGLKFKGSAAKLFFNDSYDFSETGTKIAARIAQELTADISAIGHAPAALACTGLPAKQNWFATSLAGALNLAPFAPDLKSWCEQTHLVIPDSTVESSLTPAWLGFLYLIGSYQPASPEKSVWQPDWTRSTPPPAPAPAVVIAPAAVIAPPKPAVVPAAVVPPVAPAKPAPFAFTPMPPKPATPGAAVPPAKPAVAVPPAAPAKPFAFTPIPPKPAKPAPAPFTPTPPKPATPAALPVKPAAPAPAKPAAPPAKPLAAPPPRPIAAPPPRPVAAPAPVKPATPAPKPATPSLAKPAMAPASSSAKPGFLKSTTGMIVIACAVLALAAAGYFVYSNQKSNAEQTESDRHNDEDSAKIKLLAAQKAHDDAVFKKAQEDAAAKLAAAEAAANAAEEQARVETAAHIAAARGQINITTEPTGALVTIGNLPPRTAPALFPNLKLGHYPVTVVLRNHETAKLDLEVKENETADPGVIRLAHQTGSLEITSDPAGATYSMQPAGSHLFVDPTQQRTGTTPVTFNDLPTGDYIVTFSRDGFVSHDENVTVDHSNPAQVSWKLTNGNVLITSNPSGARVTTSDGQILGLTPVTINDVAPGDVAYTLNLDGYDPATLSGKTQGGMTTKLEANLLSVDRLAKLSELDVRPQPVTQEGPELPPSISESGEVDIAITVDRSGNPRDPKVVKNTTNNPEVARLCLAAIAKWKFKPGIIDDKPVNVRVTEPFAINP